MKIGAFQVRSDSVMKRFLQCFDAVGWVRPCLCHFWGQNIKFELKFDVKFLTFSVGVFLFYSDSFILQ